MEDEKEQIKQISITIKKINKMLNFAKLPEDKRTDYFNKMNYLSNVLKRLRKEEKQENNKKLLTIINNCFMLLTTNIFTNKKEIN